jgi:mono/diheme cytochrome c family protein
MNTSKQVNVMIGLLFLSFLTFGAYIVYEPGRVESAQEARDEVHATRGAQLFVDNCRTCHGLLGLGGEEGALAPALNSSAYLILPEDNPYGLPATPEGEAREIYDFLFNTTACGRVNSAMPLWSERYGGSMSERQIDYIVHMITSDRWDLVEKIGTKYDADKPDDAPPVLIPLTEAGTLSLTNGNCGQYSGAMAADFRNRDPFADPGTPGEPGEPEPLPDDPLAQAEIAGVLVGAFYTNNCAVCHGPQRGGGVGPALTPAALTQADSVYFDVIKNGRTGTAMPPWGSQMTDDEINSMVQYLKNVSP